MVKQNSITDQVVINACNEYTKTITKFKREGLSWDNKGNSLERLMAATMLPEEDCLEAMENAISKEFIEYVLLIQVASPTQKGLKLLEGTE